MKKGNSSKINVSTNKEQVDDSMKRKLEKIIEKSRTENEALRKILEGLEKLNENSKKNK